MYSPIIIANYFIKKGKEDQYNDLTPMKLQKLVYYAHGWYLALYGDPLIDEQVEAWEFGPVVPRLYRAIRSYGNKPIDKYLVNYRGPLSPSPDVQDFLSEIWRIYGHFSGVQLSNMTHSSGTPWSQVKERYQGRRIPNGTDIETKIIKNWFKEEANTVAE